MNPFDEYIEATVYSKPLTDPDTGEWNMDRLWVNSVRTVGDMAAEKVAVMVTTELLRI